MEFLIVEAVAFLDFAFDCRRAGDLASDDFKILLIEPAYDECGAVLNDCTYFGTLDDFEF